MQGFFARMRERFQRFMVGRYGSDQLSRFMLVIVVILVILNIFFRKSTVVFSILSWFVLILTYLRMFSRNIQRRYNENTRYLMLREKVTGLFRKRGPSAASSGRYEERRTQKGTMRSDAQHRIFRCPRCDQRVRVPRGKGTIEITCPKCGHVFRKRN